MRNKSTILILISLCALAILILAPMVGLEFIPAGSLFSPAGSDIRADIFWKIRLPRVFLAFFAGAGLAVSGMAFQAVFRNPLATPFTLGVSGGAAFGAAVYLKAGVLISLLGLAGQSMSSFLGAMLSIAIVYGLTRVRHGFSTATMLLAGVAVSFFFSSLILFVQYLSDYTHSYRIMRWLMGSIDTVGYRPVLNVAPFVIAGGLLVIYFTHELNLMSLSEETAISRGVNVRRVKTLLFFGVSLMVGAVVAHCGPIGFVGMMCPHICRLLIGPDHRTLTPATLIFGGTFLVACDMLSRTLIAPAEIPIGVITALLGGPFFLWLLLEGSSERGILK